MLSCEGYKMFRGSAVIVPKTNYRPPYKVEGDWLYKPEYRCWYCKGSSYPEEIVTDIVERVDECFFDLMEKVRAIDGLEITKENEREVRRITGSIMEQLASRV